MCCECGAGFAWLWLCSGVEVSPVVCLHHTCMCSFSPLPRRIVRTSARPAPCPLRRQLGPTQCLWDFAKSKGVFLPGSEHLLGLVFHGFGQVSWLVKMEEGAVFLGLLSPPIPPHPRFLSEQWDLRAGSLPTSSPLSHSLQEVPSLPDLGLTVCLDVQVGQKCIVHPETFIYVL